MQYQTLRSVADNHLFVVCRDGDFYSLPDHVRHRGPWQGQHRGEIKDLPIHYLIDLEEQGYAPVRCEVGVFKPEPLFAIASSGRHNKTWGTATLGFVAFWRPGLVVADGA